MATPSPAPLTWESIRIPLSALAPWKRNPRSLSLTGGAYLRRSFEDFGQVDAIAVGPPDEHGLHPLYNGHQRLAVLLAEHGPDYLIDARQSSRPLTEKEREKLTVLLHRGAVGDWDFDVLANEFELDELLEWGFTEKELTGLAPKESAAPETLLDQAIQLEPGREYVLVACESEDDWERLKIALNLQPVRRGGYKPGSPFDDIGTERVILAERLLALLAAAQMEKPA